MYFGLFVLFVSFVWVWVLFGGLGFVCFVCFVWVLVVGGGSINRNLPEKLKLEKPKPEKHHLCVLYLHYQSVTFVLPAIHFLLPAVYLFYICIASQSIVYYQSFTCVLPINYLFDMCTTSQSLL